VTLLDAYGLVGFLVGAPAAPMVQALLRSRQAAVATVNLAETFYVAQAQYGYDVDRALTLLEPLLDGVLVVRSLEVAQAERAARIRLHHYHRTRMALSLADCVLLASAGPDDRIATSDSAVLQVAALEAIATLQLP